MFKRISYYVIKIVIKILLSVAMHISVYQPTSSVDIGIEFPLKNHIGQALLYNIQWCQMSKTTLKSQDFFMQIRKYIIYSGAKCLRPHLKARIFSCKYGNI